MINILLNASISGSIVILMWYLSYPLSKKYFRASWHYAVLKITMIFMIFPVSIFTPMFNGIFGELFVKPNLLHIYELPEQIQMININAETINSLNSALSELVFPVVQRSPTLTQTEGSNLNEPHDNINIAYNSDSSNANADIPYLQIIWLVVAAVLFSVEIRKMHRFKRQIFSSSDSNVDYETQELFLQCKEQLKVRGRITLRTSEYIKTPLAFGLSRRFIVFPAADMSADEKRIALVHELTHIKNGDLWTKFFASVISAVHWFNPSAHMMCRKIAVISEEYCDECVVKSMTKEERFIYGSLILKVASDIAMPQSKYCSTLSASTKNIKRRLSNMMNIKKSRKSMIALSVIVALIMCSFSTIYAFATDTNNKDTDKNTDIMVVDTPDNNKDGETSDSEKADDNLMTYDEFKELIETIVKPELQGLLGTKYSQEEIDKKIAKYEQMLYFLSGGNFKVWKCYPESINDWYYYTSLYCYYAGKVDGDNMGFGANTYEGLYTIVSNYFERQIKSGKMKLEEAAKRLAEMSPESTEALVDGDWKRIENPPHIK